MLWKREASAAFQQRLREHGIHSQTLEQTWFAGAHSNVGGGYEDSGLADIAFGWMARKAIEAGLDLDEVYIASVQAHGTKRQLRNSRTLKWCLLRPLQRALCTTPDERIHASVLTRMDSGENEIEPHPYNPRNVRELMQRKGRAFLDLVDNTEGVPTPNTPVLQPMMPSVLH